MNKMNIFAIVTLCTFGAIHGLPGGYLAKGGVYDFKRPLDYFEDATHAGKKQIVI